MKKQILGIVGGGQLGRMLAEAGRQLSVTTVVLDPTPDSPAGQVADKQLLGKFDDYDDVKKLADEVDVMTFEIESANAQALEDIERERPGSVHPLPKALAIIKDKYRQKEFLQERGISVAPFQLVNDSEDIKNAAGKWGYPLILKSRFGAYDGRGNASIENEDTIPSALEKLASKQLYVEAFVPFTKELAVVAVRTRDGDIRTYPVVETIQKNHICHLVLAPAPVDAIIRTTAEDVAKAVLSSLPGAGVFAIEMFLTNEGEVIVNEIAPRVHNSGHFTIEACETSQFEQHVRAVMDIELGSTEMKTSAAAMINILGERTGPAQPQGIEEAESLGNVKVHIYGKAETKPERKMGHITVLADTLEEAREIAEEARLRVSI